MVLILASWVLQYLLCHGWGLLVRKYFASGELGEDDWFWTPLVGFFGIYCFCLGAHFFVPLRDGTTFVAALIGGTGWIAGGRSGRGQTGKLLENWSPRSLLLLGLLAILGLNFSTAPPSSFDAGAYHSAVIRWAYEYPLITGLGNVNGHYAFNNSHHLYHALLDGAFGAGRSTHLVSSFLWFWCALGALRVGQRWLRPGEVRVKHSLIVFLAPLLLAWTSALPEPTSDFPANLALLLLGALVWRHVIHSANSSEAAAARRMLWLLAAWSVSIKISTLVFAAACMYLASVELYREIRQGGRVNWFQEALPAAVAIAALSLWSLRSIYLSGYAAFPSTLIAFDVPWRIPDEYASWYRYWIQTYARDPYSPSNLGDGWSWLRPWLNSSFRADKFRALLPALIVASGTFFWVARKRGAWTRRLDTRLSVWWVALALALTAWFLSAPATRFGAPLLWLAAASMIALAIQEVQPQKRRSVGLFALTPLFVFAVFDRTQHIIRPWLTNTSAPKTHLWIAAGPDWGLHPSPRPELAEVRIRSGLELRVPARQDCGDGDATPCLIWRAPLPAATVVATDLSLLNPSQGVAGGFRSVIPPEGWVAHYARQVGDYRREHSSSVRQLTHRFLVPPRYIEAALELAKRQESPRERP